MTTNRPKRKGFAEMKARFSFHWKGRNLIKEIRKEQKEAREKDPSFRKLIVKHLPTDEQ
jgi:hypothetical protein